MDDTLIRNTRQRTPGQRTTGHDFDTRQPAAQRRPGPGSRKQLGLVNAAIEAIGARATGRKRLGVFATIGRAKRPFRGWLIYSATMMPFGELSRTDTELIILRVAHGRGADYERDHHRVIGKRAGLTDADIAAVDRRDHGFTGRRGAMLEVADQLVAKRTSTTPPGPHCPATCPTANAWHWCS